MVNPRGGGSSDIDGLLGMLKGDDSKDMERTYAFYERKLSAKDAELAALRSRCKELEAFNLDAHNLRQDSLETIAALNVEVAALEGRVEACRPLLDQCFQITASMTLNESFSVESSVAKEKVRRTHARLEAFLFPEDGAQDVADVSAWRVMESAPKNWTTIILLLSWPTNDGALVVAAHYNEEQGFWDTRDEVIIDEQVLSWQPLPLATPAATEEKKDPTITLSEVLAIRRGVASELQPVVGDQACDGCGTWFWYPKVTGETCKGCDDGQVCVVVADSAAAEPKEGLDT